MVMMLSLISFPCFSEEGCQSSDLIGTVEAVKISAGKDERSEEGMFNYQIKIRSENINSTTNTIEFSDSLWLSVLPKKSSAPSILHNISVSAFYSQHPVKVSCNAHREVYEIILGQNLDVLK